MAPKASTTAGWTVVRSHGVDGLIHPLRSGILKLHMAEMACLMAGSGFILDMSTLHAARLIRSSEKCSLIDYGLSVLDLD